MTAKEVCEKYNISESTLITAFKRAQKGIIQKYGIKIVRTGRGNTTSYSEEKVNKEVYKDSDKNFIFFEGKNKNVSYEIIILLMLITTPMQVYKGTYRDFFEYINMKVDQIEIFKLKKALNVLRSQKFITFSIDATDSNYFIVSLCREFEKDLLIDFNVIDICKSLGTYYGKRDWCWILKVWLGIELIKDNKYCSVNLLQNLIGLQYHQIRTCGDILLESRVFKLSKCYNSLEKILSFTF